MIIFIDIHEFGSGTSRTPYISVNSIWYTFNLVHHPFHIQAISYTAISYPIHYVYCNPVYYTMGVESMFRDHSKNSVKFGLKSELN